MDPKKFGEFLATVRKDRGLTQNGLAEQIGVTNKAVSKWETGKCLPDISKFEEIAAALGISVLELLKAERMPEERVSLQEASALCTDTVQTVTREVKKQSHRQMCLLVILVLAVILAHYFPVWRVAMVWSPSYFETGEVGALAYIGSAQERHIAQGVLAQAEEAFSTLGLTGEEAKARFGVLSRYTTAADSYGDAVGEEHTLELWSARFGGSLGSNRGQMWVYYSHRAYDAGGETVRGSWDIPSLWYLEKNSAGKWEVTHIKEHP